MVFICALAPIPHERSGIAEQSLPVPWNKLCSSSPGAKCNYPGMLDFAMARRPKGKKQWRCVHHPTPFELRLVGPAVVVIPGQCGRVTIYLRHRMTSIFGMSPSR